MLIEMARGYLDPSSIFQIEVSSSFLGSLTKFDGNNITINCSYKTYYIRLFTNILLKKSGKLMKVIN